MQILVFKEKNPEEDYLTLTWQAVLYWTCNISYCTGFTLLGNYNMQTLANLGPTGVDEQAGWIFRYPNGAWPSFSSRM